MFQCCICHQHARTTIAGILKHIREVHPFFRGAVTCGLDGCAATPSSYEALKAHVYRYHKNLLTTTQYQADYEDESVMPSEDQSQELEETEEMPDLNCPSASLNAARFIMKARDGKGLTQAMTCEVVDDVKIILENSISSIKSKVMHEVKKLSANDHQVTEIESIFSDESIVNPFLGLETQYKQDQFIASHFNYVVKKN